MNRRICDSKIARRAMVVCSGGEGGGVVCEGGWSGKCLSSKCLGFLNPKLLPFS